MTQLCLAHATARSRRRVRATRAARVDLARCDRDAHDCRVRIFFLATLLATPCVAAERTLSVTDFDRIRVDGGFVVDVRTGAATTAVITGTTGAIESAVVAVQGRQLNIRRNRSAWGGYPGQVQPAATIRITTPSLLAVQVSGPAKVTIERLKGMRVAASLEGAGTLSIANVAADRLDFATFGAGTLTLAGTVAQVNATTRGSGIVDTAGLVVQDMKLSSESAGVVTVAAKRLANIIMTGTGSVSVIGSPACSVKNSGAGTVVCGGSNQP